MKSLHEDSLSNESLWASVPDLQGGGSLPSHPGKKHCNAGYSSKQEYTRGTLGIVPMAHSELSPMAHERLFWWGGWLLPTSAMLSWLPGVLLLITVLKTVHNNSPALQGGIISIHASVQEKVLHKTRELTQGTFM